VNCICCSGNCRKSGSYRNRNRIVQRYACDRCGKSFSESQPLDGLRIETKQAEQVVHLLVEGMGIRAIGRLTGLHRDTVLSVLETAGQKAAAFLDAKIRNVKAEQVQADELTYFVKTKEQNTPQTDLEHGMFFTFLSIDRASKLIINWRTAKRTRFEAGEFIRDLQTRIQGRFQLTTDGWHSYCGKTGAVRTVLGNTVDYATEIKSFGSETPRHLTGRYSMHCFSTNRFVKCSRQKRIGNPDMKLATTCHCERTNLSVRTFTRRFTRYTIGYSKKLDNLRHAVALFIWHFNFVRVHSAHGQTPAQAVGLTEKALTITELLESAI